MAIIKDVTVKINNGTATLDAPVQFYEKDHDVELRFRLMDYKYKYDKDPQNILNSVDEDVLEAYTTIVNPRGYELEQINGVVKNDVVIFRLDPTYTDELDELGTYKLQIHIKCTHSEFTIPPITFEVLERLKGIKVVTDGEDEVDNSEILDNSSKFVSDETGKLIIEWKKGDMISSAKLNAMVDVINDAVDEEKIRQENEIEREKKANNKIQELENTRVEYVNKFDDELDSFADQVDTTMSDYETRFNALTVSQQQDAEIIDARDGEQTLRARLDRDIQKPSIIYEDVEGSYINVDTTCGYLKDIEILGNTIQDQNDLADIRSVGDKLEGQELYEIPVLSRGKNLFDGKLEEGSISNSNGNLVNSTTGLRTVNYIKIPKSRNVFVTHNLSVSIGIRYYDKNYGFISSEASSKDMQLNIPKSAEYIKFMYALTETLVNIQFEEGTIATPYEPYQEQQITILSPTPLEKVGDVADRIICKDGVWGVEKNIKTVTFDGSEQWGKQNWGDTSVDNLAYVLDLPDSKNFGWDNSKTRWIICDKCIANGIMYGEEVEGIGKLENNTRICIKLSKEKAPNITEFKNYLSRNNFLVKYVLEQPTFIPLPYDQQIKLRTFANKTNIHFLTEIEPTLKASVPKSLGASVSSHTEQIDNLSKELDKVKKLEESATSTVTTESDFITVKNTSNGYFEDVKLEGKTLVNTVTTYDTSRFSLNNAIKQEDGYYKLQYGATVNDSSVIPRYGVHLYKPNTTYTIIVDIKENTTGTFLGISAINSPISSQSVTKKDFANLTGISTLLITTRDDITLSDKGSTPIYDLYFGIWKDGGDLSKHITFRYWVLEGDHTQNPPSYFEGLKSVGQDVEQISVLSTNKEETKEDKKRILYYNDETQSWEKPILRQWDSIEKHSDGKYYYHKRSGEVVLNGSENWGLNKTEVNTTLFIYRSNMLAHTGDTTVKTISDRIPGDSFANRVTDIEMIYTHNNEFTIRILNTKLSTQDVAGFKAWLQANPTTVVYQLAEEKVYECTDLDLITYQNETNLMVESGAIVPKTTLKIHQNIANIATILQEKVNLLENNVGHVNCEIDNINTDLTSLTESNEGSFVSVVSKDGYLKNVEILGNTIQNQNDLADIRSVGDKVEGQELYEIPVLCTGKNLFDKNKIILNTATQTATGLLEQSTSSHTTEYIRIKANTNYSFSGRSNQNSVVYDSNYTYITKLIGQQITTPSDAKYIRFNIGSNNNVDLVQLEEGTVATPYEPHQEQQITILSPVQLEKVGDVADRIICKDGVWGVEKSIKTKVYNGSEKWSSLANDTNSQFVISRDSDMQTGDLVICNQLTGTSINKFKDYTCYIGVGNFNVLLPSNISLSDFVNSLKSNNLILKYKNNQPQFIPLPHDQQIKLRTFANKTNISFGCEIEPTLKASVPKSIGATVNSHTEQIDNLGKELDRVKKLEESIASTVTTESDFTTVTETSNGYFEDVKIEGKTLVNLSNTVNVTLSYNQNTPYERISNIQIGKLYTLIVKVDKNTCDSPLKFSSFEFCGGKNGVRLKDAVSGDYVFCPANTTGVFALKVGVEVYGENGKGTRLVIFNSDATVGEYTISCLLLEGDHTQNPPSYFEGLKSIGQDVDEISVESINNGNLFNGYYEVGDMDSSNGYDEVNNLRKRSDYIVCKAPKIYFNNNVVRLCWYDKSKQFISYVGNITEAIKPKDAFYFRFSTATSMFDIVNTIASYNQDAKNKNIQSDKKRILYYNDETQAWEKPVLREWDSIEKHSDGKYYYHKRSGEVVLNGSEFWREGSPAQFTDTHMFFACNSFDNLIKTEAEVISDKFVYGATWDMSSRECIDSTTENNKIRIRINKSKLSTQDVEGFKQWLQANNVTVVYQLAAEEIYECTSIDLITYENETNFIVNAGAIAPVSTLKVMCNINNVVRELQQKVSNLENYIQHVMIDALNNALNE